MQRYPGGLAWGAAVRAMSAWQPIETAPKDGSLILVYAPAADGLSAMQSTCSYHPDAGFCIDEIRDPIHWMPLPDDPPTR